MTGRFPRIRRWLRRLFALILLAALLVILALMRPPPERLTDANGAKIYVIDGDSLRIGNRTIRMEGIDAVELHQLCRADGGVQWSCGLEARKALNSLVAQGSLVCEAIAVDQYHRTLAQCSTRGSRDIAADLVAQGWAVSGDGRRPGPYAAEQENAEGDRRGIWRGTFERPADWRAAHPRAASQD